MSNNLLEKGWTKKALLKKVQVQQMRQKQLFISEANGKRLGKKSTFYKRSKLKKVQVQQM